MEQRNAGAFDKEMEKLDRWGEDQRISLKTALADLDESIRASKKEARQAPSLAGETSSGEELADCWRANGMRLGEPMTKPLVQ